MSPATRQVREGHQHQGGDSYLEGFFFELSIVSEGFVIIFSFLTHP